jgi:uncharacterized protein YndB with AHSA1/START domain
VQEVKVSTVISASCEDVFDVLVDLSRRPAFSDHYLKDFRLSTTNPRGEGATARFLLDRRIFDQRGEIRIAKCERPHRIVEEGSLGRLGRSSLSAVYELQPESGGCRVQLTTSSEPKKSVDRLREKGVARWMRRNTKKALKRLGDLLEDPAGGSPRGVTVAAYEPQTAPRYGDHVKAGGASPSEAAAADG